MKRIILAALIGVLVSGPVWATGEFIVNPFSQQALRQLNWRSFPTKQYLKHFKIYSEELPENVEWKFIYDRKFQSEFGKTSEAIQRLDKNGNTTFRLNLSSKDDAVPHKCDKARDKIERAIGKAVVFVDTSNTSKVLLDKKSELTMDWHNLSNKAQWFVGKTSLTLGCLGFGKTPTDASSKAIFFLIVEEKQTAIKLKPILWLACSIQSKLRFSDGTERQGKNLELVFGVDFNHNNILRLDNSVIDHEVTINEGSIEFKLGARRPVSLKISRITGLITGEDKLKEGSISAVGTLSGNCNKFDKVNKKF